MASVDAIPFKTVTDEPWSDIELPDGYELTNDGVYRKQKEDSIRISGPVWISASTKDINTNYFGVYILLY